MQFSTALLALAAAASSVVANTVTFWTLDDATRTIYFTPSSGHEIDSVTVNAKKNTTVTFPDGYIGNYYAIQEGDTKAPGMLGEVTFGGWNGLTYFDVSAIVNAADHNNVKQMWPKNAMQPMSGCEVFPCNNAYYLPDDVQTKVTEELDLISTLGEGSVYPN